MYSNPVINSISEITSYKQFAMDMLVSEYLQKKMDDSSQSSGKSAKSLTIEKTKDPITDPYQSPKRDLMCSQCGQDSRWCVCHLNIIDE